MVKLGMINKRATTIVLVVMSIFSAACEEGGYRPRVITIRNDIQDERYNSFIVDQVVTMNGQILFRQNLQPGDEVALKQKGVRSMRLTRQYEDYARVYIVHCPLKLKEDVKIKLIDVHTNKLSGGCYLAQKGERNRGGYTKWVKAD